MTKLIKGVNDLATIRPDLAAEWHPIKNGDLKPTDILSGSNKKVWWKCYKNHEYEACVMDRKKGHGCPYCAGKRPIKGVNDLFTTNPELADEWNYEKNITLNPENMMKGSMKKVWWIGKCGHEWMALINDRSKGHGCPYCAGKQSIKGVNDLKTINSKLAFEWNYEKNKLMPEDVTINSNKKVWWKCSNGHEWEARIQSRTNGNGCPYCAGDKIWIGFNDLESVYPELASEWNYEKNKLTPKDVTISTSKKVWWKCSKGHEWMAAISNRSKKNGTGCPICSESRLEKNIRQCLYFYDYKFKEQVKFNDLVGYGDGKLSYDFGINNNNDIYVVLIEAQGLQHYEAIDFFGGEEQFAKQQLHDELKREYAEKNNIKLVEIPYWYSEEDIKKLFEPGSEIYKTIYD